MDLLMGTSCPITVAQASACLLADLRESAAEDEKDLSVREQENVDC